MKKYTKTAGLLFMAAASVYYGQAVVAAPGKSGSSASGSKNPATEVKLLDDLPAPSDLPAETKPATTDKPAETKPATETKPADNKTADAGPTTKPADGRSVSKHEVAVNDEGTVEIHVNDASLVEVLRMLSLQSQKNIVCSKDVRGTVTANLYNVTIREALDQILHMNGYAYREKGNFINVYTIKELQQIEDAEKKVATEVIRLYYTPAANAMNMVKPVLSTAGQVSATTPAVAGISSGATDVGGNSHSVEDMIVVTDYPENIDKVKKILKELDRRPQQILVEATILRAALSEDNALGIDFTVLGGVDFSTLVSGGSNVNQALNGAILNNSNSGAQSVVNNGYAGGGTSFTGGVPNGGLRVGLVKNNVAVFISALEQVTDTVVLANPKVLALNKQKGEVIVGRKDGYLTTTVTESATVQTVEFLDTGTRLIFRPFIGDDGHIRMELHPEDSSGGLTGSNLPFKITTELTSNVMVKDGHTIVIGGLFREASDSGRGQVPFLGNIPLAGPLFRNQRDRTSREEIIIMLTPHIIKDESVYAKLSDEEMKKAEKLRVGVRKGMMPWGRERLAEGEYEKALAELAKTTPNNQKALWHLESATNLNPKFVEAIELKQKVSGKEVTTVDSTNVRSFVKKMVLADKAPAAKVEGQPEEKKTSNPTAQAQPETEPFAEFDWDEFPFDPFGEEPAGQPEADKVVTEGSEKDAEQPKLDAKPEEKVAEAPKSDQPEKKPEDQEKKPEATAATSEKKDQPAEKKDGEMPKPDVTVTELPLDEVKPSDPKSDDNK